MASTNPFELTDEDKKYLKNFKIMQYLRPELQTDNVTLAMLEKVLGEGNRIARSIIHALEKIKAGKAKQDTSHVARAAVAGATAGTNTTGATAGSNATGAAAGSNTTGAATAAAATTASVYVMNDPFKKELPAKTLLYQAAAAAAADYTADEGNRTKVAQHTAAAASTANIKNADRLFSIYKSLKLALPLIESTCLALHTSIALAETEIERMNSTYSEYNLSKLYECVIRINRPSSSKTRPNPEKKADNLSNRAFEEKARALQAAAAANLSIAEMREAKFDDGDILITNYLKLVNSFEAEKRILETNSTQLASFKAQIQDIESEMPELKQLYRQGALKHRP